MQSEYWLTYDPQSALRRNSCKRSRDDVEARGDRAMDSSEIGIFYYFFLTCAVRQNPDIQRIHLVHHTHLFNSGVASFM